MRRNLGADRMQREEQRFGDDVKSKVGEEGNEQRYADDQAQHEGQRVCPVMQQEIAEMQAIALDEPNKRLLACRCGKSYSTLTLFDLLERHTLLPSWKGIRTSSLRLAHCCQVRFRSKAGAEEIHFL